MVLPASGTVAIALKHAARISTFALPMSSWPLVRPAALSDGALPWRNIRIWLTHVIHPHPLALWWIVHALWHTAITMAARLISNIKMDQAEIDWQFRKLIRHFRNEKETGASSLSQRFLGLLLGTREILANSWPARVPSKDPRSNCGTLFFSSSFLVSKVENEILAWWESSFAFVHFASP